jgi:hypothetical protein
VRGKEERDCFSQARKWKKASIPGRKRSTCKSEIRKRVGGEYRK